MRIKHKELLVMAHGSNEHGNRGVPWRYYEDESWRVVVTIGTGHKEYTMVRRRYRCLRLT